MDMGEWVSLITNVGFPIAMCLLILYYWQNQFNSKMNALTDAISRLNDVVAKNTHVVEELIKDLKEQDK